MAGALYRHKVSWALSGVLLSGALIFGVLPYDDVWLESIRRVSSAEQKATLKASAGWLSYWGDFGAYSVLLASSLWIAGWWKKSKHLRRLALATILSAMFAGTAANVLRSSTGRPRPRAGMPDGLYGPSLKSELHALPSAHTATAFGSSLPVLVAAPQVGVPLVLFAGSVSWSRMFLNQHHPTDIAAGIWVAALFGVPFGLAVRRLRANDEIKDGDPAI